MGANYPPGLSSRLQVSYERLNGSPQLFLTRVRQRGRGTQQMQRASDQQEVEDVTPVVLVVEDEPSIAEVVALYLRRAGFDVLSAGDGQEALDVLAEATPDLVVLDLMLPKVDGYEVTRQLRAHGTRRSSC